MSESVAEINKLLVDYYGLDISLNIPKFRIVWSSSQREKRYGVFEVYDSTGTIFLRTEQGIEDVEKYPIWSDLWVLERLFPTNGNPYLELVTKFSYEPVWVFGAGNSDKQPIWRAVRLLCENSLRGDPNRVNKSPSDLIREEEEKLEKEKKLMKEMLSEDVTPLAFSLKHGCSIVVPKRFVGEIEKTEVKDGN
jgi:hypothetical protein